MGKDGLHIDTCYLYDGFMKVDERLFRFGLNVCFCVTISDSVSCKCLFH